MKLNTVIKLPDGRIGTLCWNHLDGEGGVWGEHHFVMPEGGFGDELPEPEFMLREKKVEEIIRRSHKTNVECVGTDYEVVRNGS